MTSCFSNMFNVKESNKTIGREIYFDDKLFLPRPASAFFVAILNYFLFKYFVSVFVKLLC